MIDNLISLLNKSSYDFYFLVVDKFLDIDIPELVNFYSISPEKLSIEIDEKNSGRLLNHPATIEFITNNSRKTGRKPAIIPFKPSAKIDNICQKLNYTLISNPASLNRLFEDKFKFTEICQKYNIKIIPYIIDNLTKEFFTNAQSKFGSTLVFQTHHGWAGNSSYLVNKWNDINSLLPANTLVKCTPYLKGYSLINNCCLTSAGLIQSPPGLQYTGIKPLSSNPLATVGRQWPSCAPDNVKNNIKQLSIEFSKILADYNYYGYFGLDFHVYQNEVFLIECNPRLTASFAFYNKLEINSDITPLFLFHLAQFINLNINIDLQKENHRFHNTSIIGSEITQKNSQGVTTSKIHFPQAIVNNPNHITIDPQIISQIS